MEVKIDKVEELCCDKRRALGASCAKVEHDLQEYCRTGQVSGLEMMLRNSCCVMHYSRRICCSDTSQHAICRHDIGKRVAQAVEKTESWWTYLNCEGDAEAREANVDSPGRDRLWLCWACSEWL
jgi:hypothetical protein